GNAGTVRLAMGESATAGLYQQRVNMSVVAPFKLDDFVPLGKPSCQPNTAHRRLSAAVDHPYPLDRGNETTDHLRHFYLERIWNPKAQTFRGGAADGGDHCVRRVAENGGTPGPHVIDQLAAIHRKNPVQPAEKQIASGGAGQSRLR